MSRDSLRSRMLDNKGLTLIEVLAVMVILGIIAAIAVPMYADRMAKTKERICELNRMEVQRMYETGLQLTHVGHADVHFQEVLNRQFEGAICPLDGEVTYLDGRVECSVHSQPGQDESDEDDGVPYL